MEQYCCDFGSWSRSQFSYKVQKISVNAGFICPNRDGRIRRGSCFYYNNQTFSPVYCDNGKSVTQQLGGGKQFFSDKYPEMKYLVYFQAYTNTYDTSNHVKKLYEGALTMEDVTRLVIGTRPGCIGDDLLDYFEGLNHRTFLIAEYGVEICNDGTLRLVNRGHNFACARKVVEETARRGIRVGAYIILELPGKDAEESLRQAPIISPLLLTTLKIHQLRIIRGTHLIRMYTEKPSYLYVVKGYIKLIADCISLLRPGPILEHSVNQSPPDLLITPKWGLKNYELTHRPHSYIKEELNNEAQSDK